MFFRPIEFGSPEYEATLELRRRFLREPLGLELTSADTCDDAQQHHYGLFDGAAGSERLVGGVIGKPDPNDAHTVRIRQMVIHAGYRSRGMGRLLLTEAERLLAKAGYTRGVLYARDEAAGFYRRCGYAETGATAELIGLSHLEMAKRL